MTWLHAIMAWLVHLVVVPYFALKPKLRVGLWRRFWWRRRPATLPRPLPPDGVAGPQPPLRVWAHGASAGDVLCLRPLLEELGRRRSLAVTVSALTGSGVDMARRRLPGARVEFLPFDLPGATARAVDALRPDLLLLERAEIWPALIRRAHAAGAAIAIVNGRIAPSSVAPYRRLLRWTGNVLADVDRFLVRDEGEAARMRSIGAPTERIVVTGNTKFDHALQVPDRAAIDAFAASLGLAAGQPIAVAGSTHRGEEALVATAFASALRALPTARLIVAPRYLERCDEVLADIGRAGLRAVRRSSLAGVSPEAPVILLDTMGELALSYGLARVAFVGGSLVPRGGQNMLEPAALGVPVLAGRHTEHSADQIALLGGRGLIELAGPADLERELQRLLAEADAAAALGRQARAALAAAGGASARCADELLALLSSSPRRAT
ncbi:MAG: 3-deoxy-D-manno-octulosonic acid transferase [Deltaproteobacteria bacterium]|nr:3-deoxy-D-manno-octulosonic acid transferase [Deltaproteobacteria bacterium]